MVTAASRGPRHETPSPTGQSLLRVAGAEVVGTAVLMLIGPGSAVLAVDAIGVYGVAFAFGLALLGMAYTIGHVSGCHINPAVTLGFLLSRKISIVEAAYYWAAQVVGALIGGGLLYLVTEGGDLDPRHARTSRYRPVRSSLPFLSFTWSVDAAKNQSVPLAPVSTSTDPSSATVNGLRYTPPFSPPASVPSRWSVRVS